MSKGPMSKKRYWRSLDDLGKSPSFQRHLHREFPAENADELEMDGMSRRTFVGLMGASTALAGAGLSGCVRKPAQYILPYANRPEDLIPGNPRYFASALQIGGHVQGVLVESQDGRPTKIEGNPQHPASMGRTTGGVQAAILDLYDTDRSRGAVIDGAPATLGAAIEALPALDAQTAILVDGTKSATQNALLALAVRGGAKVFRTGADVPFHQEAGLAMVGAENLAPVYDTSAAKVLVALDSDFLASGPNSVAHAAGFGAGRRPDDGAAGMNRLYAVEPAFTPTGASADNRYQLPAGQIGAFATALAGAVLNGGGSAPGASAGQFTASVDDPRFQQWVSAVSTDLLANRGRSLVVVGDRQPAFVHALGALLNAALGNVGATVNYRPSDVARGGSLRDLAAAIEGGSVSKLVILGANPVYAAPGDIDFGALMAGLETSVHVGFHYDETGRAAKVHIPQSHALEAWGDLVAADGTAAIVQPLIEPLFASYSSIEVLSYLVGAPNHDGLTLVKEYWGTATGGLGLGDSNWRRWLHDGVIERTERQAAANWSFGSLGGQLGETPAMPTSGSLQAVFAVDNKVFDGRFANNAWLQELPDPISKITWDNAALINPVTARALNIPFGNSAEPTDGDRYEEDSNIPSTLRGGLEAPMVTVTVNGKSLELPAVVVPGVAENTVLLPIGYGRQFGTVASVAGFPTHDLQSAEGEWIASGATLTRSRGSYPIATTQDHGSMEGRPLIREATVTEYADNPHFVDDLELMPGGKLYSLWDVDHLPHDDHGGGHGDDHGDSHGDDHGDGHGDSHAAAAERDPGQQYWETDPQQWGMSIDLTSCIACGACSIACQAENNISVVGKERVLEGREMAWIRLDRYFAGDPANPEVRMQPVACMHCENAPCEQVCPVAATTHGPQGTNDMAYNRCIGTRYCANNCPYKVRRFNFFNFSRENDERNPLLRMQKNPDVTVRFRGVMEKCTYCIQRINHARIEAKVNRPDGMVQDGTIVTACEQACPTGGIVFGNVADPHSRVSQLRAKDRDYALLSWVNSHPRTTYLAKISNPNPELV